MQNKLQRQLNIKDIILEQRTSSQEAIKEALQERGFAITQATLSRDLNELGVLKKSDKQGGYYYALPGTVSCDTPFIASYSTLRFTGNLAVVNTEPGQAMAIASAIDQQQHLEILGTIAGYNTLFIACKEGVKHSTIAKLLNIIIPNLQYQQDE